jgi:2-methylisocitrate lyase-like PEP mutase family enzyme
MSVVRDAPLFGFAQNRSTPVPKPAGRRTTWNELLEKQRYVQLPVAHDALTAKLIEQAGFPAYQVGGFAVDGTEFAYPDADLTHLGEKSTCVERIIQASVLPVLVDADDGYGDATNVTRTVQLYESMGVDAIFIEDQKAPKRCGHMSGKAVVPTGAMVNKVLAACAARHDPDAFFILARTDAREPEGLEEAIDRATRYRKAGADGVYVEGPRGEGELKSIGKAFKGFPLATSILERGGVTPWVAPKELYEMGFTMLLYPATVVFRATYAIRRALNDLHRGKELDPGQSVDMKEFERIVDMPRWQKVEKKFGGGPNWEDGGRPQARSGG